MPECIRFRLRRYRELTVIVFVAGTRAVRADSNYLKSAFRSNLVATIYLDKNVFSKYYLLYKSEISKKTFRMICIDWKEHLMVTPEMIGPHLKSHE
jgi:hypothetical protein